MKRILLPLVILGLPLLLGTDGKSTGESPWRQLFNGRDLSGWQAIPAASAGDWSVKDGIIVGRGRQNRLSYLQWHETDLTDFELTLRYRIHGPGNTGIEIRAQSDPSGKRPFVGYHADLGHVGIGDHILGAWDFHFADRTEPPCRRSTRLTIERDGTLRTETLHEAVSLRAINDGDWNRVRVIARGDHFEFFINGKIASAFSDHHATGRLRSGAIALQIHDAGTRVDFTDIRLRKFTASKQTGGKK